MREIKFRVWDNHAKRYLYDVAVFNGKVYVLNYEESNFVPLYTEEQKEAYVIKDTDIIIELYTGLNDKNGKEVYEGDIILHRRGLGGIGVIQFACGIFGVNWNYLKNKNPEWKKGDMYGTWGTRTNLRRIDDGFLEEYKIIGNIHENLELLKTNSELRAVTL
jgi:uncharacterized phage protein (TIGR01671 family)